MGTTIPAGSGGLGTLTASVVKATAGVASAAVEGVDFNVPVTDQAIALYRAQTLLGATLKRVVGLNFDNDSLYATTAVGTSGTTIAWLSADGGGIRLNTTATNNRGLCMTVHGGPIHIVNPRTSLWYMRARLAISVAVDAQTLAFAGWCKQSSLSANPMVRLGVDGGVSTGFYSLSLYNNANSLTGSVVSSVAVDTNFHTFEAYNNGTSLFFVIDGTAAGSTASSNIDSSQPITVSAEVYNGTTAAARQLDLISTWMVTAGS